MAPDDAFVAELALSSPEIRTLSRLTLDAELRLVDEYRDSRGREHGVFWVTTGNFDRFERSLTESALFESWERLVATGESRLYNIVVAEAEGLTGAIELSREFNVLWERVSIRDGRLFVRAIVPDREALQGFREAIRERGIDFALHRATSEIEAGLGDAPDLSAPQREVLELAYERGYYEQPRQVTLAEIGAELGISESAVSGRLNRGLATLLEGVFSGDDEET